MSEAVEREVVARVERALDEAYSRYAGLDEESRVEGLAEALQQALASEPEATHADLLDHLARRHTLPPASSSNPPSQAMATNAAELEDLRREIERLRQAQSAVVVAEPAALDRGVLEVLLGADAQRLESSVDPARVAGVVKALTAFAVDLVKGFLSAPGRQGDSIVQLDRFRNAVRAELSAASPAGGTDALLEETKRRIGVQLEAFSVACSRGAKSLLDELGPEVLEDLCGDGGFGPFKYRGMWETFVRRHRELADAEDLFETYFDPALRNAMFQLGEKK